MMSCFAYSTGYTTRNIIFEITIKSLVFTIFNFKISKITTAVLGGQRSFFHINIGILLFLFGVCVITTGVTTILIIKRPIWSIIRYFTHAFRINWHWFMGLLCHSKYLTHRRRSWSRTINSSNISFLHNPILFTKLFKISMLQRLSCRHPVIMVVNQELLNNVTGFWILRH